MLGRREGSICLMCLRIPKVPQGLCQQDAQTKEINGRAEEGSPLCTL